MSFLRGAALCVVVLIFALPCTAAHAQVSVVKSFPTNTLDGLITQTDISLDKHASSSGGACLKINATRPRTIRLFEVSNPDVDDAKLIFQARIRTRDATDKVFLEMWCRFPGQGEFFSRGLDQPLMDTTGWTSQEIPFVLQKGQKPDLVKLNVVILGRGTVWLDDVKLVKAPLK